MSDTFRRLEYTSSIQMRSMAHSRPWFKSSTPTWSVSLSALFFCLCTWTCHWLKCLHTFIPLVKALSVFFKWPQTVCFLDGRHSTIMPLQKFQLFFHHLFGEQGNTFCRHVHCSSIRFTSLLTKRLHFFQQPATYLEYTASWTFIKKLHNITSARNWK